MTDERKISKATALDELSGLFEQVAADPGGEWLNGGHASTLGWAATTLTDFEARIRAEVAGGIAVKIEQSAKAQLAEPVTEEDPNIALGLRFASKIARLAAGSSPYTTQEPASRCGVCGGQLGVQGCVRRCNTTPEPKRRYPRTSELTDQERYEIEEAAAAHRAEVDPDEVDRRDG